MMFDDNDVDSAHDDDHQVDDFDYDGVVVDVDYEYHHHQRRRDDLQSMLTCCGCDVLLMENTSLPNTQCGQLY